MKPILSLLLSPIAYVSPEVADWDMSDMSLPSQTVSDTPAADAYLLEKLLGPPSLGLPWPTTASSAFTSSGALDCPASLGRLGSPSPVPRWRLAREGTFLFEILPSYLSGFGAGCSFRCTTYRSTVYTHLSSKYGLPLHHPRFLEWIGAPESASLLGRDPGKWLHSLSREQAIEAARQLHWDVCLMTTNLNVLDQYVLCLQGTASKMLELSLGSQDFSSAAVATGAGGPRVRRAAVKMEAIDPATYR